LIKQQLYVGKGTKVRWFSKNIFGDFDIKDTLFFYQLYKQLFANLIDFS